MFHVFPWRQEKENQKANAATASEKRQIENSKEIVLSVETSNEPWSLSAVSSVDPDTGP